MPILKIVAVALITAILTVYLKKNTPEITMFVGIAGGILIIFLLSDYLFNVAEYLKSFFEKSGIESELIKIVVKIIAVAYLFEFASSAVKDLGENSLAEKVIISGKVIILTMSFPILNSLFNMIVEIVNG